MNARVRHVCAIESGSTFSQEGFLMVDKGHDERRLDGKIMKRSQSS